MQNSSTTMRLISISRLVLVNAMSVILIATSIDCIPMAFNPNSMPVIPMPAMHPVQMMSLQSQYDPYSSLQLGLMNSFVGNPILADQSNKRLSEPSENERIYAPASDDEDKPINDISPLTDSDERSTISERISESFSALGEGVRNHFRSSWENFSDTMDDLKDAWRSDSSKKRHG